MNICNKAMNSLVSCRYSMLKNTNMALHSEMENMQQKLDSLQTRKLQLEDELSMSHVSFGKIFSIFWARQKYLRP